jgi:hypothetical protein
VFLTKSSRKKTNNTFLKLILNAMIRNIKIHNTLNIIEISYLWNVINVFKKNYENVHLSVSYDFSKFDGSKKIKV